MKNAADAPANADPTPLKPTFQPMPPDGGSVPNWKRDGGRIVARHDIMDRLESLRETARLMEADDVSPDPRRVVMLVSDLMDALAQHFGDR